MCDLPTLPLRSTGRLYWRIGHRWYIYFVLKFFVNFIVLHISNSFQYQINKQSSWHKVCIKTYLPNKQWLVVQPYFLIGDIKNIVRKNCTAMLLNKNIFKHNSDSKIYYKNMFWGACFVIDSMSVNNVTIRHSNEQKKIWYKMCVYIVLQTFLFFRPKAFKKHMQAHPFIWCSLEDITS